MGKKLVRDQGSLEWSVCLKWRKALANSHPGIWELICKRNYGKTVGAHSNHKSCVLETLFLLFQLKAWP